MPSSNKESMDSMPANGELFDPRVDPPTRYVAIEPQLSGCGRHAFGSWDILVNKHASRRIRATIRTTWIYMGTKLEQVASYNLNPLQRENLGCDYWRGDFELQEFDRTVVAAIYL